ncbi:MAG: hypothetical protein PUB97_04715 [Ruminococcus sp.]|nr:hypothetical protein [Ruminococcus sp.]
MTNFEKIKEMTEEEFAVFLDDFSSACVEWPDCANCMIGGPPSCDKKHMLKWLRRQAGDEQHG